MGRRYEPESSERGLGVGKLKGRRRNGAHQRKRKNETACEKTARRLQCRNSINIVWGTVVFIECHSKSAARRGISTERLTVGS